MHAPKGEAKFQAGLLTLLIHNLYLYMQKSKLHHQYYINFYSKTYKFKIILITIKNADTILLTHFKHDRFPFSGDNK